MKKLILALLFPIVFIACEVPAENDFDDFDIPTPYTEDDYRAYNSYAPAIFTGNINGQYVVVCDTTPDYDGIVDASEFGGYILTSSGYHQGIYYHWARLGSLTYNVATPEKFRIEVGNVTYAYIPNIGNYVPKDTLYNYIKTGLNAFQYSTANINPISNTNQTEYKVQMRYTDINGVEWTTYAGAQTGSNFAIVDTMRYTNNFPNVLKVKYKARFNCKLYNSTGQSITLDNGYFIGEFWDGY